MGLTKTEIFTGEQNELAVLLKALAHPARIAILPQIIDAKACICGDLSTELGTGAAHDLPAFKGIKKCRTDKRHH